MHSTTTTSTTVRHGTVPPPFAHNCDARPLTCAVQHSESGGARSADPTPVQPPATTDAGAAFALDRGSLAGMYRVRALLTDA